MSGIPEVKKEKKEPIELAPQEGPQTEFFETPADIAVFGGEAGGGKTWALLYECLRFFNLIYFTAVIFRRISTQITKSGGLWDESMKLYSLFGGKPKQSPERSWSWAKFKSKIEMAALQYDIDVFKWQGTQIALLIFDELTHFSEFQFFYMLSRLRTSCGIRPYVRCSTNPDAESWVRQFIDWWIDPDTGLAIKERSGKIRYMLRLGDKVADIKWADSKEELRMYEAEVRKRMPPKLRASVKFEDLVMSVTFIHSSLSDNRKMLEKNPGYPAFLLSLDMVERERLLGGNWNIKYQSGTIFNRSWFEIVKNLPRLDLICRGWDFAATEKELTSKGTDKNDPDYTAGVLLGISIAKRTIYVLDVVAIQGNPGEVDAVFYQTCLLDKERARRLHCPLKVRWEIEGGSAGKREAYRMVNKLKGFDAEGINASGHGDKYVRLKPMSREAYDHKLKVLEGDWNDNFLGNMHAFEPKQSKKGGMYKHDDIPDGLFYASLGLLEDIDFEDTGENFIEFD